MRPNIIRADQVYQQPVVLTGGINESVTTLELQAGELLRCINYTEVAGPYGGYASAEGYEVYDGQALASSVAVTETVDPGTGASTFNDTAREAQRALIQALPGSGKATGVWVYNGIAYGVRNAADGLSGKLYKATGTGWSAIAGTSLNPTGNCRFVNARFSAYPAATPMTNQLMMFMVDGVSQPISWDGTTLRVIDHASLPSNAAFLPAPVYPSFVGQFENRLFLVYRDQVFFSAVGDAANFDGVAGAGQIPLGDEVTNVILAPGNALVFIMRNSIKILYTIDTETADFYFQMKEFSGTSGGLSDTAVRIFGDIFFADDRGPTSIKSTSAYGDFASGALTLKTQRTYLNQKSLITAAVASKENSQYRLFFSNGSAIYYTLYGGKVKGSGFLSWPLSVRNVVTGEDANGNEVTFFTADDTNGFVYKMDSGTSFNGAEIDTYLTTAFYHYGSIRRWKHFISLAFQMSAENRTVFKIKTAYDYNDTLLPKNPFHDLSVVGVGGVWGISDWGDFIWGGSYAQQPQFYCYGYGTTMAVAVATSSKYRSQHVIHDYVVDFSVHDRRM